MASEPFLSIEDLTSRASVVSSDSDSAALDFAPGLELAFPDQFQEFDCALDEVSGKIPDFLRGVYYMNGPARFGFPGFAYRHWLDGDGMVCALRFTENKLRLRSRYVRTRKFEEERSAGRPLFRAFGTNLEGSRLNRLGNGLESPANVSAYHFNDSLLAFGEQGLPWQLDPETLETREQCNFNGRLNQASPFSAHPKFDAGTGEMFNFGIFFSQQAPKLYFYCIGPEGLRYRRAIALEQPSSVHDFSISKQYAIFYISPFFLDIKNVLQHGRTIMDSLEWRPEHGSRLLVVNRGTGNPTASISLGSRYCLHLINSFEKDQRLVVDVLEFDEPLYRHYQPVPDLFHNVGRGNPVRFIIDLKSWELVERISLHYFRAPDFPAIDPSRTMQPYNEFWVLGMSAAVGKQGRKFFDELVHADWNEGIPSDSYRCPPMCYLGAEPVFIGPPGSSGKEGVIICQEFDARKQQTSFLLFDKNKVRIGPVARIPTPRQVHLGFHAVFVAT